MITTRPDRHTPDSARATIQTGTDTARTWVSTMTEAIEANAPNARTCPTRPIQSADSRAPTRNPRKYADPTRPTATDGKPSAVARRDTSDDCRPVAPIRRATPANSGITGHSTWRGETAAGPVAVDVDVAGTGRLDFTRVRRGT